MRTHFSRRIVRRNEVRVDEASEVGDARRRTPTDIKESVREVHQYAGERVTVALRMQTLRRVA